MLFRKCAGGVVFNGNQVFLIQNDKNEWVFPKGVVRNGASDEDVAIARVYEEGGVQASILCTAGITSYEFYSITRRKPVCNEITWYIMQAKSDQYQINDTLGFENGGFFTYNEAIEMITYSQDRTLLRSAYERYRDELAEL